jgi:hypothetical protein
VLFKNYLPCSFAWAASSGGAETQAFIGNGKWSIGVDALNSLCGRATSPVRIDEREIIN